MFAGAGGAIGLLQIETKFLLFGAFDFQLLYKSVVTDYDGDESAGGPRKGEQSGNSDDGADDAVVRVEVNLAVA